MPETRKPVPGCPSEDLSKRLENYRARLAAEGRTNAVAVIDQALGKAPKPVLRAKAR